jgi:hypothetical protein
MTIRNALLLLAGVLMVGAGASRAHAGQVLYQGVGFLQGTQSFSQSFNLTSPGTLTVTLGNVNWPTQLSSLNLLVTSVSGAAGPEMGAGISTFNVNAGDVFAQWFGTAQGPLNAGVYSLEIQFQPSAGSGNAVPLPTSIALFLSGLGLLIWQRRSRSDPEARHPEHAGRLAEHAGRLAGHAGKMARDLARDGDMQAT